MIEVSQQMYTYALFIVMNCMVLALIVVVYFIRNIQSSVLSTNLFQVYFILGEIGWLVIALNATSDTPVSSDNSEFSFLLCSYVLMLAVYKPLQVAWKGKALAVLHAALVTFFFVVDSPDLEAVVIVTYSVTVYGAISAVCFKRSVTMHNVGHAILGVGSFLILVNALTSAYIIGELQDLNLAGGFTVIALATTYTLIGIGFLASILINEHQALALLSMSDPLTSIYNRRGLEASVQQIQKADNKQSSRFSVITLDLDHFKDVNDNHGHDAGDLVLKSVARLISSNRREADTCSRIGGEEFVVVLPGTALEEAAQVAESLRASLEIHDIRVGTETLNVTASFGVASQTGTDDLASMLTKADKALYNAKKNGRNRVCTYQPKDNNDA